MRDIEIIVRPELKSCARKLVEISFTLFMWVAFIYFSSPLVEALVLFFKGAGQEAYPLLKDQLLVFIRILLCVAIALVALSTWSYYNWLAFGRKDRRRKVDLNFLYLKKGKASQRSEYVSRHRYHKEVRLP